MARTMNDLLLLKMTTHYLNNEQHITWSEQ